MNKHTDIQARRRILPPEMPLYSKSGDHSLLDARAMLTNPRKQPTTNHEKKSLLLYEMQECVRLAPQAVQGPQLEHLRALVAEYTQHSKGTHPRTNRFAKQAPKIWGDLLHSSLITMNEKALAASTPDLLGQAWERDGDAHPALASNHSILNLAHESHQIDLLLKLGDRFVAHGQMRTNTPHHYGQYCNALRGDLQDYVKAGGDLQTRSLEVWDRMQRKLDHLTGTDWWSLSNMAYDIADGFKQRYEGDVRSKGKATNAYSQDWADHVVTTRGQSHGSQTLEVLYNARWARFARTIADDLYYNKGLINNPAITADVKNHTVAELVRRAERSVSAHQKQGI